MRHTESHQALHRAHYNLVSWDRFYILIRIRSKFCRSCKVILIQDASSLAVGANRGDAIAINTVLWSAHAEG